MVKKEEGEGKEHGEGGKGKRIQSGEEKRRVRK